MFEHEQQPELQIIPAVNEKEVSSYAPEIGSDALNNLSNEEKREKEREKEIEDIIQKRDNPKRIH